MEAQAKYKPHYAYKIWQRYIRGEITFNELNRLTAGAQQQFSGNEVLIGLYPYKREDDAVISRLKTAIDKGQGSINLLTDAKMTIERLQEDLDSANSGREKYKELYSAQRED